MGLVADNIAIINERIRKAAEKSGRDPGEIRLVCVAKGRSVEEVREAIKAGITDIGENKVQEAVLKYETLNPKPLTPHPVIWHMVGHLQTNKARGAVKMFDLLHSVDSLKLANEVDKEARRINKVQDILIEVNTSGEETKFGIRPKEVLGLVKEIVILNNIKLLGLMTIAPIAENKEEARPYFRRLRELQGEVNKFLLQNAINRRGGLNLPYGYLSTLSMGMSQDYEAAVEEGATMVRIGTAIFEG